MAKLRQGEKRVQLSFQREEDLRLFAFMTKKAYKCRWEVPVFILAALQDAFGAEMDNEEVDAVAEEAMAKVRERQAANIPLSGSEVVEIIKERANGKPVTITFDPPLSPPPVAQPAMTPDDAYEQALKQVQALNAEPMKKKVVKKDKVPT